MNPSGGESSVQNQAFTGNVFPPTFISDCSLFPPPQSPPVTVTRARYRQNNHPNTTTQPLQSMPWINNIFSRTRLQVMSALQVSLQFHSGKTFFPLFNQLQSYSRMLVNYDCVCWIMSVNVWYCHWYIIRS